MLNTDMARNRNNIIKLIQKSHFNVNKIARNNKRL